LNAQGEAYISLSSVLQVCLQSQALHLAASVLLLTFNLVQGKL
jgi:hypothetical protein